MILTKSKILKQIKKGKVKIEPFEASAIGSASIDLALNSQLRIFNSKNKIIEEDIDYKKITKLIDISKGYILKPGELVLGMTKEKVTLPNNICGWLNSRSRYARIGLMSHITSPFIAPGFSNKPILEIYNASPHKIRLMPGTKLCQLTLQKCKGKAKYQGKFKEQGL